MKAIFSHVSLDWREMGERIATLSRTGKRIGAKKHPKGSPAPFQLRITPEESNTITSYRIELKIGKL